MGASIISMLAAFQAVLSLGMHNAGPATFSLYKILATIEIAGLGLWWLYSRDNNIGVLIFRVLTLAVFLWIMQDWQILVGTIQAGFMKLGIILGGNTLDLPSVHGAGMALIDKGYAWSVAIQGTGSTGTLTDSLTNFPMGHSRRSRPRGSTSGSWGGRLAPLCDCRDSCLCHATGICLLQCPRPLSRCRLRPGIGPPGSQSGPLALSSVSE